MVNSLYLVLDRLRGGVAVIENALDLAVRGFFVFPLVPNKKTPIVENWTELATRNLGTIREWWNKWPTANVGIYCGKFGPNAAPLLVADIDEKTDKHGLTTKLDLELDGLEFPATLAAETATGGLHLIYEAANPVKTSANALGKWIDVRGHGGYIVAVGSVINGKAYRWREDLPVAAAPAWMTEKAGTPSTVKPAERERQAVEVDQDYAYSRGLRHVMDAEETTEGGRNDAGFKMAAAVRDYGVDESGAGQLLDVWNRLKCFPPMDAEEIDHVISSAYQYAKGTQGANSPEADFPDDAEAVAATVEPAKKNPLVIMPLEQFEPAAIPKRRWILGNQLLGGKITVMIAPPGAGKTTYSMGAGLSVATGKAIMGVPVVEQGNVLLINNEDDTDEMDRRLAASMQHYNITFDELQGKLWLYSGVSRPFIIARKKHDDIKPVDKSAITEFIKTHNIVLMVVDPFLETHEVNENDNREINQVGRMYREIANETECAILIVHHTRKIQAGDNAGHVGNPDSGRGASALTGVARIMFTLYSMSPKDAKEYGVNAKDRHKFVRLDDAKANMSLIGDKAKWFKKVSVKLSNGDSIGVLDPVASMEPVGQKEKDAILSAVQLGVSNNSGRMSASAAADFVISSQASALSKTHVRARIITWLAGAGEIVNGWRIWYEHDESPGARGKSAHFINGHVETVAKQ